MKKFTSIITAIELPHKFADIYVLIDDFLTVLTGGQI
jgi:hypothetical protein